MSDQSDRPSDVVVHNDDRPDDHDNQPDGWSLEDAADHLGITVNAVRQRIKRGTLDAKRTPDGWVVFLPTNQEIMPASGQRPTGQPVTQERHATNQPGDQAGIAPLVDLVADLTRQNAELSAAAALWQERARFLGERLAALEAGPMPANLHHGGHASTETAPDPSMSHDQPLDRPTDFSTIFVENPEPVPQSTGIRRWWRRVMGYEG